MYISTIGQLHMVQVVGTKLEFDLMVEALKSLEGYHSNIRISTTELTTLQSDCVLNCIRPKTSTDMECAIYDMEASVEMWKRHNRHAEVRPKTISDRRSVWRYIDCQLTKIEQGLIS